MNIDVETWGFYQLWTSRDTNKLPEHCERVINNGEEEQVYCLIVVLL